MKRIFHTVLLIFISCSGLTRHNGEHSEKDGKKSNRDTYSSGPKSEALKNFEKKLGNTPSNIPKRIEDQIGEIDRIKQLIGEGEYNDAFLYAKRLDFSSNRQVKARAAYLKGEILFQQKEYDLAMQLLEEMIGKYAFSGVVLIALNRLILCAEKLQLAKKKKQYYSILHDFFQAI